MSQLTKQAILSAFLDLLDEKPFDRISVVDIAQKSRINRNTFYCYYPDIMRCWTAGRSSLSIPPAGS